MMKKFVVSALFCGLVVACGGGTPATPESALERCEAYTDRLCELFQECSPDTPAEEFIWCSDGHDCSAMNERERAGFESDDFDACFQSLYPSVECDAEGDPIETEPCKNVGE